MDTETVAAPKTGAGKGVRIDILARAKARNMFLFQAATYAEISAATGIPMNTLGGLISRAGWAKLKREREQRLTKSQDARIASADTELVDAIASASEQHALRALQKTGEALERNDRDAAKDSQAYSATAKNLVSVVRAIREGSSEVDGKGTRMELNLFFMGQQAPSQQPKQAETIDVKAVKSE